MKSSDKPIDSQGRSNSVDPQMIPTNQTERDFFVDENVNFKEW